MLTKSIFVKIPPTSRECLFINNNENTTNKIDNKNINKPIIFLRPVFFAFLPLNKSTNAKRIIATVKAIKKPAIIAHTIFKVASYFKI